MFKIAKLITDIQVNLQEKTIDLNFGTISVFSVISKFKTEGIECRILNNNILQLFNLSDIDVTQDEDVYATYYKKVIDINKIENKTGWDITVADQPKFEKEGTTTDDGNKV